jgi:DNA-binding MarR family transcriptional regulator
MSRQQVSQPAMTQLVDRLTSQGLVRRHPSATDRRWVLVEITDTGRDALAERLQRRVDYLDDLLAALSAADRTAITRALPALERLIAEADATGSQRPSRKEAAAQ